jgi:hypothetical protein
VVEAAIDYQEWGYDKPIELESMEDITWAPQKGSQATFLSCPIFEVLYHGTRGPGKTDALVMDFCQFVGKGFGSDWRGILFRRTYPELQEVVAKTRKWIPKLFPGATFNESKYTWNFPEGEKLFLRYAMSVSDYDNYHGHEYPWVGWEELTNWANSELYDMMKACCRSSTPGIPRRYRATTNPHGIGHGWVKLYFIDAGPAGSLIVDEDGNERTHIKGHISENVILLDADPLYIKRLMAATKHDPDKRKAWLDGDWDIVAGGIFDTLFKRHTHILKPFRIPSSWRVDRSFDDGDARPFSIGYWAEADGTEAQTPRGPIAFPAGTLIRVYEYYGWTGRPNEGSGMLPDKIAKMMKEEIEPALLKGILQGHRIEAGPADNTVFDANRGNKVADLFDSFGISWEKSDKSPGSRITGVKQFKQRLSSTVDFEEGTRDPEPCFYVFDTCTEFLRTVPTLMRDKRKVDDVDTDQEDHIWDETRYRIMAAKVEMGAVTVTGA